MSDLDVDEPDRHRPYTVLMLRLVTAEARAGRLVGLAELVETGERAVVRGPSDLLTLASAAEVAEVAEVAAEPPRVSDSRSRGNDGPDDVVVVPVAEVARDGSATVVGRS